MLVFLNISICYLIIGFNDITLAVELKEKFHLTHTDIGYCFAVATVCYGVCIYLWGFLCNSIKGRYICQSIGFVMSVGGLFLLGPCQLFGIKAILELRLIGQALLGIGLSALFTSSMLSGMHHLMHRLMLPDDLATHGFFSGLMFFSLCLGYLVGHAGFAGVLLDSVGYDFSVATIILIMAMTLLFDSCYQTVCLCQGRRKRSGYTEIGAGSNI